MKIVIYKCDVCEKEIVINKQKLSPDSLNIGIFNDRAVQLECLGKIQHICSNCYNSITQEIRKAFNKTIDENKKEK